MAQIDAHQHFWNLNEAEYPWLTPEYGPIYKSFTPQDLEPQLRVAGIDKTVLVQAANSYEDTASMLSLADCHGWIGAVIGWVDLMIPEEVEKRITMYKGHPKFRGVRHLVHTEPNLDWVMQPVILESLKILEQHDMIFEIPAVFPNHLKYVPPLAQLLPKLKMVIDHLAKPPISTHAISPWDEQLQDAAAFPNVYAKMSGLNTAADWETWSAQGLQPYVDHAINVFGGDRLMFGSDWPVCNLAGTYQSVWIESNKTMDKHPGSVRSAILGGTAAKLYRI